MGPFQISRVWEGKWRESKWVPCGLPQGRWMNRGVTGRAEQGSNTIWLPSHSITGRCDRNSLLGGRGRSSKVDWEADDGLLSWVKGVQEGESGSEHTEGKANRIYLVDIELETEKLESFGDVDNWRMKSPITETRTTCGGSDREVGTQSDLDV